MVAVFLYNCSFCVNYTHEPATFSTPKVSLMIANAKDETKIMEVVTRDPALANECSPKTPFLDLRHPLVTSLAYERETLAQFLVNHGASVEAALKLVRTEKETDNRSSDDYLEQLERKLLHLKQEPTGNAKP